MSSIAQNERLRGYVERLVEYATQQNSPLICEYSRLVLAECIRSACIEPGIWNHKLQRVITNAFLLAIGAAVEHYRVNVVDRFADFLILKHVGFIPNDQPPPTDSVILRFHVAVRNLGREFQRESELPQDDRFGRDELRNLCVACEDLYQFFYESELVKVPNWQNARDTWESIEPLLKEIVTMSHDSSITKAQMRQLAMARLKSLYQCVENTARKIDATVTPLTRQLSWWQVLPNAFTNAAAFPLPELPRIKVDAQYLIAIILDYETWARKLEKPYPENGMKPSLKFSQEVIDVAKQLNLATVEDLQRLREDIEIQERFPDQYVAYLDDWRTEGKVHFLERRILAHDSDYETFTTKLDEIVRLQNISQELIRSTFVHNPENAIRSRESIATKTE